MKKRKLLYAALILSVTVTLSACFHDHSISISVNDDEDIYKMKASFDENQTRAVQRIINEHLREHISLSTIHGFIDTDVTLDDGASCHIKSRPGSLRINFDKSENTEENCERLKEMCEEIKDELTRRKHNDN
jgi:hypothetical protein